METVVADADRLWADGVRGFFAAAESGQLEPALEKFRASLARPSAASARTVSRRLYFVAELLLDAGCRDEALRCLQKSVQLDPLLREAHVALSLALSEAGDGLGLSTAAAAAIVEGGFWVDLRQRPASFLPGLDSRPFWDAKEFQWVQDLEASYVAIRRELEGALLPELDSFGSGYADKQQQVATEILLDKLAVWLQRSGDELSAPQQRSGRQMSAAVMRAAQSLDVEVETISPGDRKKFPRKADMLRIHYNATVAASGEVFDTTREKNKPLKFRLGSGQVMPGLEEGIMQMSLGERARLKIPAAKAFGAEAVDGLIPPNSDVEYDVILVWIGY
ncbi:unnamed protein product [Polarella glacialis]|uniref:peptidylprolyl isomerase n=1 Tax=Polarella glacialis TaxID=89957 RepID=A0A813H362_POLGL|nr:unnamed protein product [Polarella glacialis]